MASSKITPVRKQYLELKRQYPDAILFFRLGDFYETFDDDAHTASRELDLVLTGRNVGKNSRVPMAGVPHHAAEGYIAKLIGKGYKVALCEQIGTETVKGLMPREVVRVFTAGTVTEPGMLQAEQNNYLAAVAFEGGQAGLAYVDITTGEFAATQLPIKGGLSEELARLRPAELLTPDNARHLLPDAARPVSYPAWRFDQGNARLTLQNHFKVKSLDGFGCQNKPLALQAAGAVLQYLIDTQKEGIAQLQRLSAYSADGFMALDAATRRNLELIESLTGEGKYSLLAALDHCRTPMGARLLRQRVTRPLLEIESLNQRLDQVEAFFSDGLLREELQTALKKVPDLERLTNRAVVGRATPRDLGQIVVGLGAAPNLAELIAGIPALQSIADQLNPCQETLELLQRAIAEDSPPILGKIGVIRPGFSAELDGVMNSTAHARDWVANLEPRERERTGIASLKVGFNKVFGYYIEITRANSDLAPEDYIRKQTLTNAERYITPELKEYETLILNAEEQILEIERRVFADVCRQVAAQATSLLETAHAIAQVDVAAGLAQAAVEADYVRPTLDESSATHIVAGRHPVIERSLDLERYVPNDVHFDEKARIQIITGPNMSGKSTYLRQAALITLMAQVGSFVPATSAHIGIADRIFTRIGAHDELHAGRSTFMVEMVETAQILHHATDRSLLILDEIGRGTSTYDGLSIAWAIVEYLHNHPRLKPRTLFATHYHELVGLAETLPLVVNYNVAVAEEGDDVVFLRQIVPGGADRSYGIHVAQLAGLPRDVISRAKEVLAFLEEHAPDAAISPSHLKPAQQVALFPESSPILQELAQLDVAQMTPLEAINQLYAWQRKYGA